MGIYYIHDTIVIPVPVTAQGFLHLQEEFIQWKAESWARKVIWAYRKLEGEGKPFYWTDIRKISGVKRKNLQDVVPFLMKYADVDTMRKMLDLIVL